MNPLPHPWEVERRTTRLVERVLIPLVLLYLMARRAWETRWGR